MIPRAWLCGAVLALVALAGVQGYRIGHAASEARHEAALSAARAAAFAAAERLSLAEAARLAAVARADALSREMEDAAHADPDADRPALGLDSVRRLARR